MKNEAEIGISGEQKRICPRKLINEHNKSKQKVVLDGSPEIQEAMKVNRSGICIYVHIAVVPLLGMYPTALSSSVHQDTFVKECS